MDVEVKQRNRRRRRAQRMQQAQREKNQSGQRGDGGDSGDEDVVVVREKKKPPRPANRRKKSKEPLCEEDIVDGFAILQFRSYDDLELVLKLSAKDNAKRLTEIERPKLDPKAHITHHITVHNNHTLTLTQDPATSDDSGRASERLTGSSVAPRDADSSRDRLSDASSRCSSGKGYICDSEGEDDKGSDASSVIFASTPASRKHEFPGALPPSLPSLNNGTSSSPVPAPTPPNLPVPSPAPAQQPPPPPPPTHHHAPAAIPLVGSGGGGGGLKPPPVVSSAAIAPPPPSTITGVTTSPTTQHPMPSSVPMMAAVTMPPQPAAAPVAHHHPPASLDPCTLPGGHGMRTESPAVATSANAAVAPSPGQYHHPSYQPLYAPYATATYTSNTPVTSGVVAAPSTVAVTVAQPSVASHRDSPRTVQTHSPSREREAYNNVNSLSRSSVPPPTTTCPPPPTTTVSSSLANSLNKVWNSCSSSGNGVTSTSSCVPSTTQLSPAPARPTPPLHSIPMFTAPMPPPTVSSTVTATSAPPPPVQPNPNPFSAESLFQTNQADMLRRELDNRFLASQDRSLSVAPPPPPYLRTEMHQHQHHHTHVHQHTTSLLAPPPPTAATLFPTPLSVNPMDRLTRRSSTSSFKDIPKLGSVESSFYRQNHLYPGYGPSLMHPGLTAGPTTTPFVPPNHLATFQPKSVPQDTAKPKIMKTGKWNAMHVRVAWEIYHHQQKSGEAKGGIAATKTSTDLLRPPTHLFSPSVHTTTRPPPPPPPPHDLSPFPPSLTTHRAPPAFDPSSHHPGSLFATSPHLGKFGSGSTISPFTRYGSATATAASPFSVSPFGASSRGDSHLTLGPLHHHDPWRTLQRTMSGFPASVNALPPGPAAPWTLKPDPVLEQQQQQQQQQQREREAREREEREQRERIRREREERERREREEKQRRLEQQQQQERERREKERREMERREMEREREREREREQRERERLLHQQRLVEAKQMQQQPASGLRDRSPLRNGQTMDTNEIRVKEEPRTKEDELLARTDPRYHTYLRHPPPILDRSRMMAAAHTLPPHYATSAAPHWPPPPPPTDPFYRYGYNPLMDVAMRAQEEQQRAAAAAAAAFYGAAYGGAPHHPSQLRAKDPAMMHLRTTGPAGPGPPPPSQSQSSSVHKHSVTPPTDLHKKDEPR